MALFKNLCLGSGRLREISFLIVLALIFCGQGRVMADETPLANQALLKGLKPEGFFRFFAEIANIPRCSGHTLPMADYLEAFARERGLIAERDGVGNVIIRKPAQQSSSRNTVILQAHQDMVCVKEPGQTHDFSRDPIRLVRDGDWITAAGTTLGAAGAAGLATILAVLDDKTLVHPPLEALFTVDEETNMAGVQAVRPESLRGEVLINIDSEELKLAYVSSPAGGSYELTVPVERRPTIPPFYSRLILSGLKGGHSGTEINKGRANALALMARILTEASAAGLEFSLAGLDNGSTPGADNAIAVQAEARLGFMSDTEAANFENMARKMAITLRKEYRASDPGLDLQMTKASTRGAVGPVLTRDSRDRLLAAIRLMPLGLIRFVQDEDLESRPYGQLLVETSNNLGLIDLGETEARLTLMARSSVASRLAELEDRLRILAGLVGGSLNKTSAVDGWEMAVPPGRVQELFMEADWKMVGVHARLECGTLVGAMEKAGRHLDAISVGPDISGGHTTEEKLRISSVEVFWKDLIGVLAKL